MHLVPELPTLQLAHGELRIRGWPDGVPPPFGLHAAADHLHGTARHRGPARARLAAHGIAFVDAIAPPPLGADELPALACPPPPALAAWRASDRRGLVVGAPERERVDLVLAAAHTAAARTLLVARDSGAALAWQRALRARGCALAAEDERPTPFAAVALAVAAATMHWRARRHELLVVDRPEQMPAPSLHAVLDGSAALYRLGFVDAAGTRRLAEWSAGLGALLAIAAPATSPVQLQLHLPLTAAERDDHERAWHTFLAAFDRFVACQPRAGFGTFVRQARGDPVQRPALSAWHAALRVAGWNAAKGEAVADLVARHRGSRILVFTPDRASTYAVALAHLIAPVTAELPRAERQGALAAFAEGRLPALVGPRLLDLGVPEGSAQVGILVGGGFGTTQRAARIARVAPEGVVYELVAQGTIEVGRAHRGRG